MNLKHYIIASVILLATANVDADNYVLINQIMYDSPWNEVVTQHPYSNGEFVELYNGGTETVSLDGWVLAGDGTTERYVIPNGSVLASGACLVIAYRHAYTPAFQLTDSFAIPSNVSVLYQHTIILSNKGETLTLYNANSEIVDQVDYDGISNKTKPNRLYADNLDSIHGMECLSLHRTWAEFDASGHAITGTDEWRTDVVTFGTNMFPVENFYEDFLTGNQALPIGENYIVSVTPLDASARISYIDGKPSVSNGIRTIANLQYYDGLGRPSQSIGLKQSPSKKDYVAVDQYTGVHRKTRNWLPVPIETEGQLLNPTDFITAALDYYGDNRPYTETTFENSALSRVLSTTRPGVTWNGHFVSHNYGTNDWGVSVHNYEVLTGGLLGGTSGEQLRCTGDIVDHEIYLQTTTDEDGAVITTYTDKQNRILLEKRNGINDTYYVYDKRGLLRYVLPPLCSEQLTNGTFDLNTDVRLKQLAYCYQYDGRGNQIYKRLPGCEPQYMVYDALHQLVLKQDGNQRAADRWTLFGYDSIGRNIYTAEITSTQTHEYLIAFYADKWQVEHFSKASQSNALSNTGYASSLMGTTDAKVLTVNYYDTYDFLDKLSYLDKKELKYQHKSGYGYQHENAIGLLTGTRTYNLSDNSYIVTAYYYDYQGRIIQQRGTRHAGGYEKSWFRYNYDGTVLKKLTEAGNTDDMVTEAYNYFYDHTGRLLQVRYQLNNDAEITLSAFSYDSIGHLAQKLWQNCQDTIVYRYDMRGDMTHIKSKTFSEHLFYADSLENGMVARYNGNIAAAYVEHPDSVYKFAYTYDTDNRLTHSCILRTDDIPIPSEEFSYDHNGNIQTLVRHNGTKTIDDLRFNYKPYSNRLAFVLDYAESSDMTSIKEYYDNHSSTTEDDMEYDANGNMIRDKDRGIALIKYNIHNLPDTIQFTNGNQIINLYDAIGTKYKSIYCTLLPTAATPYYEIAHYAFNSDTVEYNITEYAGNIENRYSRYDTLRRVFNSEGYVERDTLYCYYQDHLGNNVAVRNMMSDSIVQRTVYYASGLPMAQSTGWGKQPYKYNGKEFVEMHGLDEYDSKARWYYPTIVRTTTMDPLAEKYYHISPYAWCGNNPINIVDLDGRKWKNKRDLAIAKRLSARAAKNTDKQLNRYRKLAAQKDKGGTEKKMMRIVKKMEECVLQIQRLQNLEKNVDRLTNSEITYTFKTHYTGNSVKLERSSDGTIIINSFDNEGSQAHELTHAAQYDKGQLVPSNSGATTDFRSTVKGGKLVLEVEAYQTEYSISEKVSAPSDKGDVESITDIDAEWVDGIYTTDREGNKTYPYRSETDSNTPMSGVYMPWEYKPEILGL